MSLFLSFFPFIQCLCFTDILMVVLIFLGWGLDLISSQLPSYSNSCISQMKYTSRELFTLLLKDLVEIFTLWRFVTVELWSRQIFGFLGMRG